MGNASFHLDPEKDTLAQQQAIQHPDRGLHAYYRRIGPRMQAHFTEVFDCARRPTVFLHGNPHMDNFAQNHTGAAMVDFDRARFGPYAYDLVRFLGSLSLRGRGDPRARVPRLVSQALLRGYMLGVRCPDMPPEQCTLLNEPPSAGWQQSTHAYVESSKKWASKLDLQAEDPSDERWKELVYRYCNHIEDAMLEGWQIDAAARCPGSMGKVHHLVLLRAPQDPQIAVLMDFKETYTEDDTPHFFSPFHHQGERMVHAGELYAPGWDQRPGFVTFEGEELWVREIPPFQSKLKRSLKQSELMEVAFVVGSQLGRAHVLSAIEAYPEDLLDVLSGDWMELQELTFRLVQETIDGYEAYLSRFEELAA